MLHAMFFTSHLDKTLLSGFYLSFLTEDKQRWRLGVGNRNLKGGITAWKAFLSSAGLLGVDFLQVLQLFCGVT